jgi:hypothetical protein
MKNIYYLIWVDIITSARKHHPERTDWKYSLFVLITMCNALNLFTIDALLNLFGIETFLIKIDIFPLPMLNSFAAFVIQYASIFILLNYFLIFRKERYKSLIEKYPHKKGKPALIYTLCSIWIGFASMILYGALK